jgi:phosphoglycerol transferase MdoB-like AlkP superfamily enzyme
VNNRIFILGSFLLNVYSAISLICVPLLIYLGDSMMWYITTHFFATLLLIAFSIYWKRVYVREQLHEQESTAHIYKWTIRGFVVTLILYTLLYLLFAAFLLLMSGPPIDY